MGSNLLALVDFSLQRLKDKKRSLERGRGQSLRDRRRRKRRDPLTPGSERPGGGVGVHSGSDRTLKIPRCSQWGLGDLIPESQRTEE